MSSAPAALAKVETRGDGQRMLVGYGAVFYREGKPGTEYELFDDLVERILPGTFDRALKQDDVRGAFNHDPSLLLGRTSAGTMRLSVDEVGLRYEIDLPDTSAGRDVAISVERRDVTGSSFAFEVTDQEFRTEKGVDIREIKGVRLYETGPVAFPAYEGTTVGVRSGAAEDARAAREAWRKESAARERRRRQARAVEVRESS